MRRALPVAGCRLPVACSPSRLVRYLPPMAFFQDPPRLGNQFDDDPMLGDHLARVLPAPAFAAITAELRELGALAGGELHAHQRADRENVPVHTPWDAWGNRVDHIEVTAVWKHAARLA